jgi:uncharacterized membrane protein
MDVAGWEAFLHGVFAIAITLLILDIRVPPVAEVLNADDLVTALRDELPRYTGFVLGFLYLGTYWLASHRTLRMLRGVDHWFLVQGLIFLLVISAMPFSIALLAEYIGQDQGRDQVALVIFTLWQLVLSLLAIVTLRYASAGERLLKPGVAGPDLDRWTRISMMGPVIWIIALGSALFLSGAITLILMALILVLFVQEVPLTLGEEPPSERLDPEP